MGRRYTHGIDELMALLERHGFEGKWSVMDNGHKLMFRSKNGAVLSYWPHTKRTTILIQGKSPDKENLEAVFDGSS